jgi:hypothetical protein
VLKNGGQILPVIFIILADIKVRWDFSPPRFLGIIGGNESGSD